MNVDPTIAALATDSADAAQLAAAVAGGDSWEWQSILDGIDDVEHCKRLLAAMAGLYVSYATSVSAYFGTDPVEFLHQAALEQMQVAQRMSGESGSSAPENPA